MKPRAVLIVAGGYLQTYVIRAAVAMGLVPIVTDARGGASEAGKMAIVMGGRALTADIYDVPMHLALVDQLRDFHELVGVFTAGADCELTVAAVALRLGTPGITVGAARACRNKSVMRHRFDLAQVPGPEWAEVQHIGEAKEWLENWRGQSYRLPAMCKAVDNCGSRGTTRIERLADMHHAFARARDASTTRTALLETCFTPTERGVEQSVELLYVGEGQPPLRLNIVDRIFDGVVELGHVNPTRLGYLERESLFEAAEQAAAAVGVDFGAFKIDAMWTEDGPRIMECTARLSGGFDCQETTPRSSGRDFISAALSLAVGEFADRALRRTKTRYAAAWGVFPRPGRIVKIDTSRALEAPGVETICVRKQIGDVIPPYDDCAGRPAFVIATGETYGWALDAARAGAECVVIETEAV